MTNPTGHSRTPTALLKPGHGIDKGNITARRNTALHEKYYEFDPDSWKPWKLAEDLLDRINGTILDIHRQAPITELQGWAYHNVFLRFLHTIGPRNAADLKTLKSNGTVKLHRCGTDICIKCPDELIYSLELYFPIIKDLCKNVENWSSMPKKIAFTSSISVKKIPTNR
jgi:hypothetical protein